MHNVHEVGGLLLHKDKVIIQNALKTKMFAMIHEGHLGLDKCTALACSNMFWIGMAKEIEWLVCLEMRSLYLASSFATK